jgi:hypothetical protein
LPAFKNAQLLHLRSTVEDAVESVILPILSFTCRRL